MNCMIDIDRHHSRLLRLDRRAAGEPLKAAAGALVEQLEAQETTRKRRRRAPERERLLETMEALVADLYIARTNDPTLWLGYSRAKDGYDALPRYTIGRSTYTTVITATDFLVASGYAETIPGYYRRHDKENPWTHGGMRTRIRATERLEAFLWEDHGVLPKHITITRNIELVRLKDTEGSYIDYQDTPVTIGMRRQLEATNALLADTLIEAPCLGEGVNPDQTNKRLYRVFNEGRFDRGGRFYGAWWINAKKRHRAEITLNGEPTVELDYSAHHLRLCYHLSGLQVPDREDLYRLEGTEGLRDAVKWAVTVLLNLGPGKRMPRPEKESIKSVLGGPWTTSRLRKTVEDQFSEIGYWFGAGRGTELQYIDGEIAAYVLERMTSVGIACLPVHDSFIVAIQHQSLLYDTMMEAYSSRLYAHTGQTLYPLIKD